jgi:hypothetical protein
LPVRSCQRRRRQRGVSSRRSTPLRGAFWGGARRTGAGHHGRKTRANYEKIARPGPHDDPVTTPLGRKPPCGEPELFKIVQNLKMARTVLKVWPLPAPPRVLAP